MSRDAPLEGLSRRHRFTAQGSFGAVLRNPRKLRSPHAVLHVSPGNAGASRLGIALTRRMFPSSVERNRVKRALREIFRRHPVKRAGLDLVVMFRAPFDARDREVMGEIADLFDQAGSSRR
jgi:ribonuclease P protein component